MVEETDRPTPKYRVNWMYHEGRVILDLDHHPVKDYRDIPLTLSSKVEGGLMEAIRRIDPRITMNDFWARLSAPHSLAHNHQRLTSDRPSETGGPITPNRLNGRMREFRMENSVASFDPRKARMGTKKINEYFWNRMSPAARAANSTRELPKLRKEEQDEARAGNVGKHIANGGGWGPNAEDRAAQKENGGKHVAHGGGSGPGPQARAATTAGGDATTPASLGSAGNRRFQFINESGYDGGKQRQTPAATSDRGHSNKRRKVHEPNAAYGAQIPGPGIRYGGTYYDPSLDPRLATPYYNSAYSKPSFSAHGIPSTAAAFAPSRPETQILPTRNRGDLFAEDQGIRIPTGTPAGAFPSRQYLAPATQSLGTHSVPGNQGILDTPFWGLDQTRHFDEVESDFISTSRSIADSFTNRTSNASVDQPQELDLRAEASTVRDDDDVLPW